MSERGEIHRQRSSVSNDGLALERIVFFSDAVIAIAITLLAIELRLPDVSGADDAAFIRLLGDLAPQYFSFVISFAVIALFWVAHHRMFRFIVRWDGGLVALNMLFLFFVVQLPMLNSILGAYGNLSTATAVYGLGLALMGLSSSVLWIYALRRKLVSDDLSAELARYQMLRGLAVAAVFALSVPLAFVSPWLAQASWAAVSVLTAVARRPLAPRRSTRA